MDKVSNKDINRIKKQIIKDSQKLQEQSEGQGFQKLSKIQSNICQQIIEGCQDEEIRSDLFKVKCNSLSSELLRYVSQYVVALKRNKHDINSYSSKIQLKNNHVSLKDFEFQFIENGEQDKIYRGRSRRKIEDKQIIEYNNDEQQENLKVQQLINNIIIVKNVKDNNLYITFEDDSKIYTQLQQISPNLFFDGNSKIIISDQYYDILFQKLQQMNSLIDSDNINNSSQNKDFKIESQNFDSQISFSPLPITQTLQTQRSQSKSLQLDINLINEQKDGKEINNLSSQNTISQDNDLKTNQSYLRQVGNQNDKIEYVYLTKIKQFIKILVILVENNWLQYVMTQASKEKEDQNYLIKQNESETNSIIDNESLSIACQLETKSDRTSEAIKNDIQKINCQLSDNNSSMISIQSMINPSTTSSNFYKINEDSRYDRIYSPKRLKERAGFDFKYKISNLWEEQIKFQSSSDTSDSECDKSNLSENMNNDSLNSINRYDNIIKYVFSLQYMNYDYNPFMMMSPSSINSKRMSVDNNENQDNPIDNYEFYNPYAQHHYASQVINQNSYPIIFHSDLQQNGFINSFQQIQPELNNKTPQKQYSSKSSQQLIGQISQQNNKKFKNQSGLKQSYQKSHKFTQQNQQQQYDKEEEEFISDNYSENNLHYHQQNQNMPGQHYLSEHPQQTFQNNQSNSNNNYEDSFSNQGFQPQSFNSSFFPDDLQPSMLNQKNYNCRGNSNSSTQSQQSIIMKQNENNQSAQQTQTGFNILPPPQTINNNNINSQISQNQNPQYQKNQYNQIKQQQQQQQSIYNSNKKQQTKEMSTTNNKINSNSSFNSSVSDHNFNHQTNNSYNSYNSINTIYLYQQKQQRGNKKIKGIQIMNQSNQKQNPNYMYNKSNQHHQDTIQKQYKQNSSNYYLPQTQSPLSALSLDDYPIGFSDRNSNSSTSTYQNNHFEDMYGFNYPNNYNTGNDNYSNYNQVNNLKYNERGNFNPQLTQKNIKQLSQQQNAVRREQGNSHGNINTINNTGQNQQYKQKYIQQRQNNMNSVNNNQQQQINNQTFNNNFNSNNNQVTNNQCCDKNCFCNQNYYNTQQNSSNHQYNSMNTPQQNQRFNTEMNHNQPNMYQNNTNDSMNYSNQNSNLNKIKKRKQQNPNNYQNTSQNINNMQNINNNNNQIYNMNNMNNQLFQNSNINNSPIYEEYQYNENNEGSFDNYSEPDNDMYYNNINRNVNKKQFSNYSGSNKNSKDSIRNNNFNKQQQRNYQNNQKPYYQNTQNIQNFINFTNMNN